MSLYLYEKFLEYMGCQWVGTGDQEEAAKAVLDAYIARAEAAERVANAVERWRCQSHAANWQAVVNCLHGYDLAKEAVRKLEGTT